MEINDSCKLFANWNNSKPCARETKPNSFKNYEIERKKSKRVMSELMKIVFHVGAKQACKNCKNIHNMFTEDKHCFKTEITFTKAGLNRI